MLLVRSLLFLLNQSFTALALQESSPQWSRSQLGSPWRLQNGRCSHYLDRSWESCLGKYYAQFQRLHCMYLVWYFCFCWTLFMDFKYLRCVRHKKLLHDICSHLSSWIFYRICLVLQWELGVCMQIHNSREVNYNGGNHCVCVCVWERLPNQFVSYRRMYP